MRRGAEEFTLRSKSFDVLAYLVHHHGHLVTKAALMDEVWPDTAVTDNSLSQCVVEIRRALCDDSQQLIRTVARQGYLFRRSSPRRLWSFPISQPWLQRSLLVCRRWRHPGPKGHATTSLDGRGPGLGGVGACGRECAKNIAAPTQSRSGPPGVHAAHEFRRLRHVAGALAGRPHTGFHPGRLHFRRFGADLRQASTRRGADATHA